MDADAERDNLELGALLCRGRADPRGLILGCGLVAWTDTEWPLEVRNAVWQTATRCWDEISHEAKTDIWTVVAVEGGPGL